MALTVTFQQLIDWSQQRAHMENGAGPLSVQEWKDLVNASVRKLRRTLAQAFGDEYFAVISSLVTVANVETINLPADFYKLLSLWWDDGSGVRKRIRRATEQDLENTLRGTGWGPWQGLLRRECGVRYAVRASTIRFVPVPTAVYQVRANYVQAPTILVNPVDTLDGYAGFEEFIPWETAAAALAKEESDASFQLRMRDEIVREIKEVAERDQSEPGKIQELGSRYWEDY